MSVQRERSNVRWKRKDRSEMFAHKEKRVVWNDLLTVFTFMWTCVSAQGLSLRLKM